MALLFQGFVHQFPQDILGKIFDELHDDKSTLLCCSLVNRVFMALSRANAFSEVAISHDNARALLDLLAAPGCTFFTNVRSFSISFVPGSQKWFPDFSRRLSRLTGITITTLKLSSSSRLALIQEEVLAAIPIHYSSLRHLDMGQVALSSVNDLMYTISNLRGLESFACAAAFQAEGGNSYSQTQQQYSGPSRSNSLQRRELTPFAPALRRLALVSSSVEYCLGYMAQKHALGQIMSLTLFSLTLRGIAVLSNYMVSPYLSLQQLSIKVDNNSVLSGVTTDILLDKLNLSNLSVLVDISIQTVSPLSPTHAQRLLDSITSNDIASVTFNLALVQGVAAIDIYLTNTLRFPSLKRVHILGTAWADARQHLPRCHARQILCSD